MNWVERALIPALLAVAIIAGWFLTCTAAAYFGHAYADWIGR